MESSQSKSPDFSLDSSPPNFSYDFHAESSGSPGTGGFEAFTNYGGYTETSPRLGAFGALALGTAHNSTNPNFFAPSHLYAQAHSHPGSSPSFTSGSTGSAGRPLTPLEGHDLTISPPLTLSPTHGNPGTGGMYHPGMSSSDMDSMEDNGHTSPTTRGQVRGSARSSTNSPPSSASTSHRYGRGERYNPMAPHQSTSGVTRSARTAARRSATATRRNLRGQEPDISDDEGDGMGDDPGSAEMDAGGVPGNDIIQRRREEIRRQRIESEQRRRDELRDGYAKLKFALPISNQKSSKVSLLDRAVTYIRQLETSQNSLQTRLDNSENELTRLRNVNEQLMRNLADHHRATLHLAQASVSAASSQTASEPPSPAGNKKNKGPKMQSF
ncbi:hypothetical protein JB92DRAFT_268102 [Gautieria morchelliformis]|nr:hypothetical protein JB92DRAFT_268102 [Gautieria morchelliformis]